jgi:hypothetical protein
MIGRRTKVRDCAWIWSWIRIVDCGGAAATRSPLLLPHPDAEASHALQTLMKEGAPVFSSTSHRETAVNRRRQIVALSGACKQQRSSAAIASGCRIPVCQRCRRVQLLDGRLSSLGAEGAPRVRVSQRPTVTLLLSPSRTPRPACSA